MVGLEAYQEFEDNIKAKPLSEDAKALEKVIKKKSGKYTEGDFSSLTGIPMLESRYAIKELLSKYNGRIRATENGDLIYDFGEQLKRRGDKSFAERWTEIKSLLWKVFKAVYKVVIAVVLIVYFIVFVLILVALIVAMLSGGGKSDNRDSRGSGSGLFQIVGRMFSSIFRFRTHHRDTYRPRDTWGYPYKHYEPRRTNLPRKQYKGRKGENPKLERLEKKSFIASIYDFVFGPPRIELHPLTNQMEVASYLKQTKGLISTSEVQALAGWTRAEAEEFMTDCLTYFDGNAEINENATFYGEFYDLTRTTKEQKDYPIQFFWDEYEPEWELTGNKKSTNGWIIFMNLFNLCFSLFMIGGFYSGTELIMSTPSPLLVSILLGWFPLIYSIIFFVVPILRYPGIKRRQREQHIQNIRKRLMRVIFSKHKEKISLTELTNTANDWRKTEEVLDKATVDKVVSDFIIDMGGDGTASDEGEVVYNFYQLNRELDDMEQLRKDSLFDDELGEIESY